MRLKERIEEAKKYLLKIGFDDAHLPELFNDSDKSYYTIPELLILEPAFSSEARTYCAYLSTQQGCSERRLIGPNSFLLPLHPRLVTTRPVRPRPL